MANRTDDHFARARAVVQSAEKVQKCLEDAYLALNKIGELGEAVKRKVDATEAAARSAKAAENHADANSAKDDGPAIDLGAIPEQGEINRIHMDYVAALNRMSAEAETVRMFIAEASDTDERFQKAIDKVRASKEPVSLARLIGMLRVTVENPTGTVKRTSPTRGVKHFSNEDIKTRIRQLSAEGLTHIEICRRLHSEGFKTPKSTRWAALKWDAALAHPDHRGAVATFISKACND